MGNEHIGDEAFAKSMPLHGRIRNLKNELVFNIGLGPEQADAVLKWVETLPVRVSASNIHAYIENGVFHVKEWKGNSEHPQP